jgi:hypothetical protein
MITWLWGLRFAVTGLGGRWAERPESGKDLRKLGFPQYLGVDTGVESIWPPKCGGGCQSIKRKGF